MLLQSKFFAGDQQDRWDYVNPGPSAVASGDVVVLGADPNVMLGALIACCTSPQGIDAGKLGSLATKGIFMLNKLAADTLTFNRGDKVFWDDVNNKCTLGPASLANQVVFAGLCSNPSASTDDNVKTDINRVGNYVTSNAEPATTTTTTSTSTTTTTTTTVH